MYNPEFKNRLVSDLEALKAAGLFKQERYIDTKQYSEVGPALMHRITKRVFFISDFIFNNYFPRKCLVAKSTYCCQSYATMLCFPVRR